MEGESEGIEWPALALDPARLNPFIEYRPWWSPWRKEVMLGMLSPEETKRQFEAWARWLENLLGDDPGLRAGVGIRLGIALLRPSTPIPVVMMNAIAGLLLAIAQEVGYLRWKLAQPTPPVDG